MRAILRQHWLFLLLLISISTFYLAGVPGVPYHPDESTYLFMSADFERMLSNPQSLAWEKTENLSPEMRYRMIDAPLTRYLIGFNRALVKIPATIADWDWSASWQENVISGAYPDSSTLLTGRLASALLFPLSLLLLYLICLKLSGRTAGIFAVIFFSLNPLVLLHTRRAMAEGILVFALLFALYCFLHADKFPFLAGLAVALAVNAKHSAALLLPVGLFAACWVSTGKPKRGFQIVTNLIRFWIGFGVLMLLLNPFLWGNPISAAQAALEQRQVLIARQLSDFTTIAPAQVLDSPLKRAAVAIAQVFVAPPVFSETGNYAAQIADAKQAYLDSFGSQVGRHTWAAGGLIAMTVLGILTTMQVTLKGNQSPQKFAVVLLMSFLSIGIGIGLLVHLAWQRYYLPLVPFTAIFAALGLEWGIKTSHAVLGHGRWYARLTQVLAQFTPDSWVS
jgi:4-amino-4-deoxy-L-arabinose transferase-like glycosyltransferase